MKIIINPIILTLCKNATEYMKMLKNNKQSSSQFEAFSRTFNGISLWLNLINISNQHEYYYHMQIKKCVKICIEYYFMNVSKFNLGSNRQYVVEAAFFSQGLLRSWNIIWNNLNDDTQLNIIRQLKKTRKFKISSNNWILFSTMIEVLLYKAQNHSNISVMKNNFYTYMKWYKGDGWYGDGSIYHFDYYNSYVIHPFLLEIAMYIDELKIFAINKSLIEERFKRYVHCLERMINKDGTYPIIGRSITYRFGAFNPLALASYYNKIPNDVSKGMLKRGLTLILKNFMKYPIFESNGILNIGFTNKIQKHLGEDYISEGSTYLCTFIFAALGIEEENNFWRNEELITSEKLWGMQLANIDHPYN